MAKLIRLPEGQRLIFGDQPDDETLNQHIDRSEPGDVAVVVGEQDLRQWLRDEFDQMQRADDAG